MDLQNAFLAHAEWKVRFRTAIRHRESLDMQAIARDDRCELGEWLHGPARRVFGGLAAYHLCVERHAEFHVQAGRVAEAVNERRFAEAEAMLGADGPFGEAASDVGIAIMRLKHEAAL